MNPQHPSDQVHTANIHAVEYRVGIVRLVRDTKEIAPSGWFGPFDPNDSTAKLGQDALGLSVVYIQSFLEEFKKFPLG